MSTIKFTLMGLGVCYRKKNDNFWTVKFPTDQKHRVVFTYTRKGKKTPEGRHKLAGKTIKVKAPDATNPNGYATQSFTEGVLDLTGDYLHKNNGVKKHPIPTEMTELKIPQAKLSSALSRKGRLNYTFPSDKPEEIRLIKDINGKPQQLAMIVGGEVNLPAGKGITVEISGENPILLNDGDTFHIDNDCHCTPETNDFRIYHKLFKDKVDDRKYEAISIKDPTFVGKEFNKTINEIQSSLAKLNFSAKAIKSIIGILTSPPPDVCEIIRIGNADELD